MKTIAIDFDGVIHRYSQGWKDGSIYDKPNERAFAYIEKLMHDGYAVFIFSTRSPWQIKRWVEKQAIMFNPDTPLSPYSVRVVPFWKKFWNEANCLGVTRRKLPAMAYIDDRAVPFKGDFLELPTNF